MSILKKILLAIGDKNFSTILRRAFDPPRTADQTEEEHEAQRPFQVLTEEVLHRVFLSELLDLEQPDILIIHDLLLPSEAESKEENQRELLQLISKWRLQFEGQLRVVVISERDKRDPFLQALVAHNVLDIFAEREFYAETVVKQLSEPPRYSNVSAYSMHTYTDSLLMQETVEEENTTPPQTTDTGTPAITKRLFNQVSSFVKEKRDALQESRKASQEKSIEFDLKPSDEEPAQHETIQEVAGTEEVETQLPIAEDVDIEVETVAIERPDEPESVGLDEELESKSQAVTDLPTRKEQKRSKRKEKPVEIKQPSSIVYQDRLIGKLSIAVTSLGHNVGSTHVSLQVATYLKRKGLSVAVVEGSRSGDFNRLRELFGDFSNQNEMIDSYFTVDGIHHYPYQDGEESVVPFLTNYQAIVIDVGAYGDSPSIMEYYRAQKRLVVASGTDWKLALIGNFIEKYGKVPFDLCIPMADEDLIKDVTEIYEGATTFRALPFHRNPYKQQTSTEQVLDAMYSSYAKAGVPHTGVDRMKWLVGLTSGVAAACIVGMAYMYFFLN